MGKDRALRLLATELASAGRTEESEACIAGAWALARLEKLEARYAFRPLSMAHEDFGPLVLVDIEDPGHIGISHACATDWEEATEGMTHFAPVPELTTETAERLLREMRAEKESDVKPV